MAKSQRRNEDLFDIRPSGEPVLNGAHIMHTNLAVVAQAKQNTGSAVRLPLIQANQRPLSRLGRASFQNVMVLEGRKQRGQVPTNSPHWQSPHEGLLEGGDLTKGGAGLDPEKSGLGSWHSAN